MRPVICQGCREKFIREEGNFVKASKGFYHKECYQEQQSEKEVRGQILAYLESLAPGKINYALVYKQLKTFTEDYGLQESGILGTLFFMHEVKHIRLMPEKGIAFVPYKYKEAKEYYEKVETMRDIEKKEITTQKVVISVPQTKRKKNLKDLSKIDFS